MAETKKTPRQRRAAVQAADAQQALEDSKVQAVAESTSASTGASSGSSTGNLKSLRENILFKQGFGFGSMAEEQAVNDQASSQQAESVSVQVPEKTPAKDTPTAQTEPAAKPARRRRTKQAEADVSAEGTVKESKPRRKRTSKVAAASETLAPLVELVEQSSQPQQAQVEPKLQTATDESAFTLSGLEGFMPHSVMAAEPEQVGKQDRGQAQAQVAMPEQAPSPESAKEYSASTSHVSSFTPESYEQAEGQGRPRSKYADPKARANTEALVSWQQHVQQQGEFRGGALTAQVRPTGEGEVVYDTAYAAKSVQPINLAYVQYLMKHYPFSNGQEQSAFNVILVCLFAKMQAGHICVNLESVVNLLYIIKDWIEPRHTELQKEREKHALTNLPMHEEPIDEFCQALKACVPCSNAYMLHLLQTSSAVSSVVQTEKPLIWDLNRLYVRRYYIYEQQISDYIKRESFVRYEQGQENLIKRMVDILFPVELDKALPQGMLNWQKVAALMSLTSNFTVISGGPGTGKTTTVFKLLLLLLALDDKNRNIMMCAPTAKAAARMGESIANQLQSQSTQEMISALCAMAGKDEEELHALLPMQASTVHGMLKVRPHLVTPVFNENNKLTCDVLIVDEVSMLELSLFAKLIAALPQGCKLILLGDKDQLSSVGAGMVLGDICSILNSSAPERLQPAVADFISRMSGYTVEQLLQGKIADHIALLQYSWRSKGVAGIGQLAGVFNTAKTVNMHEHEQVAEIEVASGVIHSDTLERIVYGQDTHDVLVDDSEYYSELIQQVESLCLNVSDSDLHLLTDRAYVIEYPDQDTNKDKTQDNKAQDNKPNIGPRVQRGEGKTFAELEGRSVDEGQEIERIEAILQAPLLLHRLPDPYNKEVEESDIGADVTDYEEFKYKADLKQQEQEHLKRLFFRRHDLIKLWIDPRFNDNYGPFLSKLRQMQFRVKPYTEECDELFALMNKFKVLCSNHIDLFGDININKLFETEVLKTYVNSSGLFKHKFAEGEFFPGKIVLITENDPMLNLVNGYVGFCAYLDDDSVQDNDNFKVVNLDKAGGEEDPRHALRLFIAMGSKLINGKQRNEINVISTLLLNHYETGYAMSIHKSQGSEYDRVAIVLLNQRISPILTKELVYTGITRAKKRVELVASDKAMRYAMSHAVVRESGLAERLFGKQALS